MSQNGGLTANLQSCFLHRFGSGRTCSAQTQPSITRMQMHVSDQTTASPRMITDGSLPHSSPIEVRGRILYRCFDTRRAINTERKQTHCNHCIRSHHSSSAYLKKAVHRGAGAAASS